jgi:hypothetical protein
MTNTTIPIPAQTEAITVANLAPGQSFMLTGGPLPYPVRMVDLVYIDDDGTNVPIVSHGVLVTQGSGP